jgi:hypothetical protein
LDLDPGETKNLWKTHPEIVAELTLRMRKIMK